MHHITLQLHKNHFSKKSSRHMGSGLFQKFIIAPQLCLQTRQTSNRMCRSRALVMHWGSQRIKSFKKWMLAGTEKTQFITESEHQYLPEVIEKHSHHEERLSAKINFKQQVLGLIETIEVMGNPFLDDTLKLLSSDKCHV